MRGAKTKNGARTRVVGRRNHNANNAAVKSDPVVFDGADKNNSFSFQGAFGASSFGFGGESKAPSAPFTASPSLFVGMEKEKPSGWPSGEKPLPTVGKDVFNFSLWNDLDVEASKTSEPVQPSEAAKQTSTFVSQKEEDKTNNERESKLLEEKLAVMQKKAWVEVEDWKAKVCVFSLLFFEQKKKFLKSSFLV
jgi:hypothetical protein